MQVSAVEQEVRTLREDLPPSIQVRHQLGEIACTEKIRRDGPIPEQSAGVGARRRADAVEHLTSGLPVRRPAAPAAPASVFDEWKAAQISGHEYADVGMKNCAAVQHLVCPHLAAAVKIALQFVECETAIVGKED